MQMSQGPSPCLPCCACPATQPAAPRTLLLPSVQGEHVHGVRDEQQQAEWRPHLGSLVGAGARGAPREARWLLRARGRIRGARARSRRQGRAVRPGAGRQVD